MIKSIWIDYINWRGERSWRRITPLLGGLDYRETPWHERQWLLKAIDEEHPDRQVKDFALLGIRNVATERPPEGQTVDVTRLTDQELFTLQNATVAEAVRRREEKDRARRAERARRTARVVAYAERVLAIFEPGHSGECADDNFADDVADCLRCALLHAAEHGELPDADRLEFELTLRKGD